METKTQQVGDLEDVGGDKAGVLAFRVTTMKLGGEVISWQEDTGTAIRRHRERDLAGSQPTDEYYLPAHTRLDEQDAHLVVAATWTEAYDERVTDLTDSQTTTASKLDTWTVEQMDIGVSVPAGEFCALRLRRETLVDGAPGATKRYWFARGVGKVKEQNTSGVIEELVAHEL